MFPTSRRNSPLIEGLGGPPQTLVFALFHFLFQFSSSIFPSNPFLPLRICRWRQLSGKSEMADLRKVAPERICGSGRVKPPATRQRRSQLRITFRTLVRKKVRPHSPHPSAQRLPAPPSDARVASHSLARPSLPQLRATAPFEWQHCSPTPKAQRVPGAPGVASRSHARPSVAQLGATAPLEWQRRSRDSAVTQPRSQA